jgi:pSer/pThr/pTyr-binding forkhead associated (FHA) protein
MDALPPPRQAPGTPAPPPDFVPLRLILEPGGAELELAGVDTLVGRHTDADVRLPLPDVGRRHCRFLWVDGHWQVVDLNSLNGVLVNDAPVLQATLSPGDRVRIGGFTFRVELAPSAGLAGDSLVRCIFRVLPPADPSPLRRHAS